ncbi:MAG: cardiolipin synthase B [Acidobacteria bacterium]|nr:cardiolipin synthase B [Acidobacteriota bacterium]
MSAPRPAVRSRKRPPHWRQANFPKRGIRDLSLMPSRPIRQRARDVWDRVRVVVRSPALWAVIAVWLAAWHRLWLQGLLAAAVSVIFLIFRPQIRELEMRLEYDFGTDSAEFLSTMSGLTGVPLVGGNRIRILNNGREFYPEMLKAVAAAQYSVTMEMYIFTAESVGWQFVEALAERARAKIPVKLLVDAVGGAAMSASQIQVLTEAGCQFRWFHPIRWYNLHRVNNRNHRKSLIIDGRVAFTGGAGFQDHWLGAARDPAEWRDIQIRIDGPAVVPLQTGFATNWLETTGEALTGPRYFPVPEPAGDVEVQTVMSSPKGDLYTASILYSLGILCARQSILIANPYFVPGPRTIELLEDAVERGVRVMVMLAGESSDTWLAKANSMRLYGKILEAGVELYEYMPTMLHQKTMLVDDLWATIGTANFDHRSFRLNEETIVCLYDPEIVDQLRETFDADLQHCRKVDLAQWKKRGLGRRAGEWIAALLQDQV